MTVIAVAGGAGKLGRAIVEALVEQGKHNVVVLAREVSTILIRNINENVLIPLLGQRRQRSPSRGCGLHRRQRTRCRT